MIPMSDSEQHVDWSKTTFEGVRREQLRQNLKMTVRERLEAMDELDRLSERMQTMPKKYPAASGSPERFEVRELQAEHRVSRMSNEIVLGGCKPTPLADYLKALGEIGRAPGRERVGP